MMPPRVFSIWTTAIVIVWDENDYSGLATQPNGLFPPPNQNKVVLTAETDAAGTEVWNLRRLRTGNPSFRPRSF
jgi:hypothetical protein